MALTKREQYLQIIKADVAKEGRITGHATRLFIENRISRQSFNAAVAAGMRHYRATEAQALDDEKHYERRYNV
jgi:hypothetical protein